MSDEYIRKADAIRWVKTECNPYGKPTLDFESGKKVIEHLERMPSADVVQVVHAYWIQTSAEDEDGNAYYSCSNCGSGESHNPIVEVPYCWKCGAKMDAQREE